jgi:hypothetical protein
MSVTDVGVRGERASESIVELVAGLAVVVLTILGLADVSPSFLVAIATIVFGVGLLLYGTAALSQLNVALARFSASEGAISSGRPTVLLAGVAGILLGVLALLGASSIQLVALAVIVFGRSLLMSSYGAVRTRIVAATPANADPTFARIVRNMATGVAALPTMAGSAAIVLGIFALCGFAPTEVTLIALLELGCFSSLTSAFVGGSFARAFRGGSRA